MLVNMDLEKILAVTAVVLASATPVVHILLGAANKLREVAATTAWEADDKAADGAVKFLTAVAGVLEVVGRYLPHVSVRGPSKK